MSGKFVRASKYRHVHAELEKKEKSFLDVKSSASGDGNFIKVSCSFMAFAQAGGGGPVMVRELEKRGKFAPNAPVLNVHKAPVVDLDFSPFNDNMLATASEDCSVKVSLIPQGGLVSNQDEAVATLLGHEKKLAYVHFHPTASNVLASASYDLTVRVWDLEKQQERSLISDHPDLIQSFEWSGDGSQLATTCKDRNIRIYDPRNASTPSIAPGFTGGKTARVVWMDSFNKLGAVGFDKSSMRQFILFDPRKLAEPIYTLDIDQGAGGIMPYFDNDTGLLYLSGKGDGLVRYYEIVPDAPYMYIIDEFRSNDPQKGIAFLPKRACNTTLCEVARAYRLLNSWIEIASFQVPRKADSFQKDIFPDAYAGVPSLTADEWFSGQNRAPVTRSMKPGDTFTNTPAAAIPTAKVSSSLASSDEIAALRKTVAEQAARILELEEKLSKLSA